jgi:hypothetical protein
MTTRLLMWDSISADSYSTLLKFEQFIKTGMLYEIDRLVTSHYTTRRLGYLLFADEAEAAIFKLTKL